MLGVEHSLLLKLLFLRDVVRTVCSCSDELDFDPISFELRLALSQHQSRYYKQIFVIRLLEEQYLIKTIHASSASVTTVATITLMFAHRVCCRRALPATTRLWNRTASHRIDSTHVAPPRRRLDLDEHFLHYDDLDFHELCAQSACIWRSRVINKRKIIENFKDFRNRARQKSEAELQLENMFHSKNVRLYY